MAPPFLTSFSNPQNTTNNAQHDDTKAFQRDSVTTGTRVAHATDVDANELYGFANIASSSAGIVIPTYSNVSSIKGRNGDNNVAVISAPSRKNNIPIHPPKFINNNSKSSSAVAVLPPQFGIVDSFGTQNDDHVKYGKIVSSSNNKHQLTHQTSSHAAGQRRADSKPEVVVTVEKRHSSASVQQQQQLSHKMQAMQRHVRRSVSRDSSFVSEHHQLTMMTNPPPASSSSSSSNNNNNAFYIPNSRSSESSSVVSSGSNNARAQQRRQQQSANDFDVAHNSGGTGTASSDTTIPPSASASNLHVPLDYAGAAGGEAVDRNSNDVDAGGNVAATAALDNFPVTAAAANAAGAVMMPMDEIAGWDVFRLIPDGFERREGNSACVDALLQALKICIYIVTFIILLVCTVLSKALLLLIVAQITPKKIVSTCNSNFPSSKFSGSQGNDAAAIEMPVAEAVSWRWALLLVFWLPQLLIFITSLRHIIFKRVKWPSAALFTVVFLIETLHTAALGTLLFHVLPALDSLKAAMLTNCTAVVPALLNVISRFRTSRNTRGARTGEEDNTSNESNIAKSATFCWKISIDIAAFVCQVSGLILWPFLLGIGGRSSFNTLTERAFPIFSSPTFGGNGTTTTSSNNDATASFLPQLHSQSARLQLLPVCLILISLKWWENYVREDSSFALARTLASHKKRLVKSRYKVYAILSLWKCVVMFGCFLAWTAVETGITLNDVFNMQNIFSHDFIVDKPLPSPKAAALYLMQGGENPTPELTGGGPDPRFFLPSLHDLQRLNPLHVKGVVALMVCLLQAACSFLAYRVGKFVCKVGMQRFSYALPISLTVPLTVSALITFCSLRSDATNSIDGNEQSCILSYVLPEYLFWDCFKASILKNRPNDGIIADEILLQRSASGNTSSSYLKELFLRDMGWMWILWLFSQTWVTLHVWMPKSKRLAKTEKLFVLPYYEGTLLDQSLSLNRAKDDERNVKAEDLAKTTNNSEKQQTYVDLDDVYETPTAAVDPNSIGAGADRSEKCDSVTKIFSCTTMWHESKEEMMLCLKSMMRLDEDQSARRNALQFIDAHDVDYYEFEAHIIVDDAFEWFVPKTAAASHYLSARADQPPQEQRVLNRYVKQLIGVIDEAASAVHQCTVMLNPPRKIPTPYGGRLVWTMPGRNTLVVHLKDKLKIRHRKRWSQVMCWYYLLGHRLMDQNLDVKRKDKIAENTYILTLDGDIDFGPSAVHRLLDLMRKNPSVGAACGRIHPTGSGPMVWYQKFEYAVGHWLQKATEHMIGCVLCSPGCFSLFRAKALMDDNVIRRYTIKSEKALDYVQFDQGEDRWLCTLLLQRGYRVEYCAAADAYTHAPEGFYEFYNQRRRWVPSTLANIMDLLIHYRDTIRVNDNISILYIAYQMAMMIGTVLGSGTILLMIVGAMVAAFKIDQWTAFMYNMAPITLFILSCFLTKPKVQLILAYILSAGYAILMTAVIVGNAIQIKDDGLASPGTIFVIVLVTTFFTAAILHPQEFFCIIHGLLFFLCIPSMYLLLMIYALCNLNIVSWGTRESAEAGAAASNAASPPTNVAEAGGAAGVDPTTPAGKPHKGSGALYKFWKRHETIGTGEGGGPAGSGKEDEGNVEVGCGNLFRVMCCMHPKAETEKADNICKGIDDLQKKLEQIDKRMALSEERILAAAGIRTERQQQFGTVADMTPPSAHHRSTHQRSSMMQPARGVSPHRRRNSSPQLHTSPRRNLNESASMGALHPLYTSGSVHTAANSNSGESGSTMNNNPLWLADRRLRFGQTDYLPSNETKFWRGLVHQYLLPLEFNEAHQRTVARDLKNLRNRVALGYFMLNALFVTIVFILQLRKDELHVIWPIGFTQNVSWVNCSQLLPFAPLGSLQPSSPQSARIRNTGHGSGRFAQLRSALPAHMYANLGVPPPSSLLNVLQTTTQRSSGGTGGSAGEELMLSDAIPNEMPVAMAQVAAATVPSALDHLLNQRAQLPSTILNYTLPNLPSLQQILPAGVPLPPFPGKMPRNFSLSTDSVARLNDFAVSLDPNSLGLCPITETYYLKLEPIGVVFVFFFLIILLIQFAAMLFHRFNTIAHILASTELFCWRSTWQNLSDDDFIERNAVEIARALQALRGIDDDLDDDGFVGIEGEDVGGGGGVALALGQDGAPVEAHQHQHPYKFQPGHPHHRHHAGEHDGGGGDDHGSYFGSDAAGSSSNTSSTPRYDAMRQRSRHIIEQLEAAKHNRVRTRTLTDAFRQRYMGLLQAGGGADVVIDDGLGDIDGGVNNTAYNTDDNDDGLGPRQRVSLRGRRTLVQMASSFRASRNTTLRSSLRRRVAERLMGTVRRLNYQQQQQHHSVDGNFLAPDNVHTSTGYNDHGPMRRSGRGGQPNVVTVNRNVVEVYQPPADYDDERRHGRSQQHVPNNNQRPLGGMSDTHRRPSLNNILSMTDSSYHSSPVGQSNNGGERGGSG